MLTLETLEDRAVPATINVTGLGSGGWFSDDTRNTSGTDLIGTTLTHAGKPGQAPTAADDKAILQQIAIVAGPAGSTYGGAFKIDGTSSNSGKSNISTIDTNGFVAASFLPTSFEAEYQWYGQPNATTRTLGFKLGIQSTQWAASQSSFTAGRSGESAWDLVLVHVPATSDNTWTTVDVDSTTGTWTLFAQAGNSYFATTFNGGNSTQSLGAKTLDAWEADATFGPILFGTGAKVTSVQFGLGSSQRDSISFVDYLQTNILNNGDLIDFGGGPVYVGETLDYQITVDADTSGTLTAGDIVTWNPTGTQHQQGTVPSLTFGVNAFLSLQAAIDASLEDGTIFVAAGTYTEQISIIKSINLVGASNGPQTLLTFSAGSGDLMTISGAGFGGSSEVEISHFAFQGNGASNVDYGIRVANTTRLDKLTVDNSSFSLFDINGIQVFGDTANAGISVAQLALTNLTFGNNGFQNIGGAGDINIFEYNGDATFANSVFTNTGTGARGAIQINGKGTDGAGGTDLAASGAVSFDNVDISGKYRTYNIGVQQYTDVSGFSFNDVKLGGATSELTGTFGALLRFDAAGSGTVAAPETIDLGNTHFRGLAGSTVTPNNIEFAPDNTFAFLRADATATIWDVSSGSNIPASLLSVADLYDVEDRILHYVEADHPTHNKPFKGFAEVVNGAAFVTATADFTTAQAGVINRAVEAVDAGGVVNIKSGVYAQSVTTAGNSVTLSPGSSAGQVTVDDLTLDSNDKLRIELNGSGPGTGHDQIVVTGSFDLNGAELVASRGYNPEADQVFVIIDGGSGAPDSFNGLPEGAVFKIGGAKFRVNYGDDVTLTLLSNVSAGGKFSYIDADGDAYSVNLNGPGTLFVTLDDPDGDGQGAIKLIEVVGSVANKSTLSVTVTKKGSGTDGQVNIGQITVDGGLKKLSAGKANLVGAGLSMTDSLGSLTLNDIRNGADITTGNITAQTTDFTAKFIEPGSDINIGTPINAFDAVAFADGTLTAPSINKLRIDGSFDADLSVAGDLKSARVGGISASTWSVNGQLNELAVSGFVDDWGAFIAGLSNKAKLKFADVNNAQIETGASVYRFSAVTFRNSHLFAGYVPDTAANPMGGGTFDPGLRIRTFTVTGNQSSAFSNSTVAADRIGKVALSTVRSDNSGTTFGIIAGDTINQVKVKSPFFRFDAGDLTPAGFGKFQVVIDFNI